MHVDLPLGAVFAFLFTMCRVAGALSFVALPGFKSTPLMARIVLVAGITVALSPVWPRVETTQFSSGALLAIIAAEACFGIAVGLMLAFVVEAFTFAAQIFGLQAGFSYSSTIDPSSQADSTVLQMAAQLTASLLFFASGADREVLRVFGRSLEVMPPGAYVLDGAWLQVVIRLGGVMVETAVRLALPVVALLICVDVMLALIGRVNAHLQLLALALPLKMLIALVMLAALVSAMPSIFRSGADRTFATLGALVQKQ